MFNANQSWESFQARIKNNQPENKHKKSREWNNVLMFVVMLYKAAENQWL